MNTYINGSYKFTIYEDGSLIREQLDDRGVIDFPTSIDIKITDHCSANCKFCHESSTVKGKHGDLDKLYDLLDAYYPSDIQGVEQCIGGGDPLSHPELIPYLRRIKARGFIPNITINQIHVNQNRELLIDIIDEELVGGIGISVHKENIQPIKWIVEYFPNIVFHVIAGVHDSNIIKKLENQYKDFDTEEKLKVLILGYKVFGFGVDYFNGSVERCINDWKTTIPFVFKNHRIIAFDNLAIEQLNVEKHIHPDVWKTNFLGEDFTFTMYIDAVKQQMAKTSRSHDRCGYDVSIEKFFNEKIYGN